MSFWKMNFPLTAEFNEIFVFKTWFWWYNTHETLYREIKIMKNKEKISTYLWLVLTVIVIVLWFIFYQNQGTVVKSIENTVDTNTKSNDKIRKTFTVGSNTGETANFWQYPESSGAIIRTDSGTKVQIDENESGNIFLHMTDGKIWLRIFKPILDGTLFKIEDSHGVSASVRWTAIEMSSNKNETKIIVFVSFENNPVEVSYIGKWGVHKKINISAGEQITIKTNDIDSEPIISPINWDVIYLNEYEKTSMRSDIFDIVKSLWTKDKETIKKMDAYTKKQTYEGVMSIPSFESVRKILFGCTKKTDICTKINSSKVLETQDDVVETEEKMEVIFLADKNLESRKWNPGSWSKGNIDWH